jgi:Tol biopolymer transport system component
VVFQVYRDGAWMLNLKDGSVVRISTDPSAEEFAWSPDRRRVAFHSRRDGEWDIWMMGPP